MNDKHLARDTIRAVRASASHCLHNDSCCWSGSNSCEDFLRGKDVLPCDNALQLVLENCAEILGKVNVGEMFELVEFLHELLFEDG